MTFVTGSLALAGALAVAIPIVIHLLFRRRRKPQPWAAMRFLLEAYRRHRRRLRLEEWLLLAVRCLLPLLLGLALARPLLERGAALLGGGSRLLVLVIDDGLASGAVDPDGRTALARHVAQAESLVGALAPGDRVVVVRAARPAEATIAPATSDLDTVIRHLRTLAPRDAGSDLVGALARAQEAIAAESDGEGAVLVHLLSDFRAGSAPLDDLPAALAAPRGRRTVLVATPPAADPLANVTVAAVEPVRSIVLAGATDGSDRVTVRLRRSGGDLPEAVSTVRLAGEGLRAMAPRAVSWSAGQVEATATFTLGLDTQSDREIALAAEIEADALPADDARRRLVTIRRALRGALVDRRTFGADPSLDRLGAGGWIRRALAPAEGGAIELAEVEPATLGPLDLRALDFAIVVRPDLLADAGWNALAGFLDDAGLVLLAPPGEANVHQWTDAARRSLALPFEIAREVRTIDPPASLATEPPASSVLRMIAGELPGLGAPVTVSRILDLEIPAEGAAETLLALADGTPLAAAAGRAGESGGGMAVVLAVAPQLDWTTLPSKPLMVPLFQEVVRQGTSLVRAARSVRVGERPRLPGVRAIEAPDGGRLVLDADARPERPLAQRGIHRLLDAAGRPVGALPVEIDVVAARTDPQPIDAVSAWLARAGEWSFLDPDEPDAAFAAERTGAPLAATLLAAVLVLLVLETILARRFSHAVVARAGDAGAPLGGALRATLRETPATTGASR